MSKDIDKLLNFSIRNISTNFNKWYDSLNIRDFEREITLEAKKDIREKGTEETENARDIAFKWYCYNYTSIGSQGIENFIKTTVNNHIKDNRIKDLISSLLVRSVESLNDPLIGIPRVKSDLDPRLGAFSDALSEADTSYSLITKQLNHFSDQKFFYTYEGDKKVSFSPKELIAKVLKGGRILNLVFQGTLCRVQAVEEALIEKLSKNGSYNQNNLLVFSGFEKMLSAYLQIFGTGNLEQDIYTCEAITAAMSAYVCEDISFVKVIHTTSNYDLFTKFAEVLIKSGSTTEILEFNVGDGSVYSPDLDLKIKGGYSNSYKQFGMIRIYKNSEYERHNAINRLEYAQNSVNLTYADGDDTKSETLMKWVSLFVQDIPNNLKIAIKTSHFLGRLNLLVQLFSTTSQNNIKKLGQLEQSSTSNQEQL